MIWGSGPAVALRFAAILSPPATEPPARGVVGKYRP
jgi:hypothetical protein